MKAKLIKKDGHYFLEVEPNTWTPPNRFHSIIANTLDKTKGDVLQLSLKNCQAIERGYDLDELAENIKTEDGFAHRQSFIAGFQKAVELKADKKFSEFLDKEKELGISDIKTIERIQWYYNTYFDKSQQTEWDVEVEMRSKDIDELRESGEGFLNNKNLYIPELDADGCLILRLKSE